MPRKHDSHATSSMPRPGWRPSLVAGGIALAIYLALAPQVAGDKDAAEFTLVLGAGGVAHPSGYPLYTLLGHPFVVMLHAFGATWAYAANAWSALGGAVAVALLHRLARRLSWPVGAAAVAPARAALGWRGCRRCCSGSTRCGPTRRPSPRQAPGTWPGPRGRHCCRCGCSRRWRRTKRPTMGPGAAARWPGGCWPARGWRITSRRCCCWRR